MASTGSSPALLRIDRTRIAALYGFVGVATAAGFGLSMSLGRLSLPLAGLAAVAYLLGLRHGFDADHIAAIDSTTRKLIQEERGTFAVGTWFSLGHSTVVLGLVLGLVLATRTVIGAIPQLESVGQVAGAAVSGTFLWLIGVSNVVIVLGVYRAFRRLRDGATDGLAPSDALARLGFFSRLLRPLFRSVDAPWKMFPIGLLFGLGFDTASEVALIGVAVGAGMTAAVPFWVVLVLPLMFTCGMVLVDSTDGVLMSAAYGWALLNPLGKVYYNLTVTVTSVVVALGVGTVELAQVFAKGMSLTGPRWGWLNALNLDTLGLGVFVALVAIWLTSLAYWRYKRLGVIGRTPRFG